MNHRFHLEKLQSIMHLVLTYQLDESIASNIKKGLENYLDTYEDGAYENDTFHGGIYDSIDFEDSCADQTLEGTLEWVSVTIDELLVEKNNWSVKRLAFENGKRHKCDIRRCNRYEEACEFHIKKLKVIRNLVVQNDFDFRL